MSRKLYVVLKTLGSIIELQRLMVGPMHAVEPYATELCGCKPGVGNSNKKAHDMFVVLMEP